MTINIHTDEFMTEADADNILFRWGTWVRSHPDLGHSKESTIGRMMREGLGAGHGNLSLVECMPPEVEIAERIILRMEKPIQKAIKVKYLARVEDNDGAKRCRCNVEEYLRRVDKGVLFTAGCLAMVA